jgi:hypothetical protein
MSWPGGAASPNNGGCEPNEIYMQYIMIPPTAGYFDCNLTFVYSLQLATVIKASDSTWYEISSTELLNINRNAQNTNFGVCFTGNCSASRFTYQVQGGICLNPSIAWSPTSIITEPQYSIQDLVFPIVPKYNIWPRANVMGGATAWINNHNIMGFSDSIPNVGNPDYATNYYQTPTQPTYQAPQGSLARILSPSSRAYRMTFYLCFGVGQVAAVGIVTIQKGATTGWEAFQYLHTSIALYNPWIEWLDFEWDRSFNNDYGNAFFAANSIAMNQQFYITTDMDGACATTSPFYGNKFWAVIINGFL